MWYETEIPEELVSLIERESKPYDDVVKVAKEIPQVLGMPSWFPALVNKIRKQGKVVRKPDYGDFTSGGDTETVYVLLLVVMPT